MYLIDYHTHTPRCNHATGTPDEYISVAIQQGLVEFGFNDHATMKWLPQECNQTHMAMQPEEMEDYINVAKLMKEKYKDKIQIKIGTEVDYYNGMMPKMIDHLDPYIEEFDYVYGSIHVMNSENHAWGVDDPIFQDLYPKIGIDNVYIQYYSELVDLVNTGYFDVIGHMDLPKKYEQYPEDKELCNHYAFKVLDAVVKKDMVIEINTSGFRRPCNVQYPSEAILKEIINLNIPIVIGSDAHEPESVGKDIERGLQIYKKLGGKSITSFSKRNRTQIEI